MAGTSAATDPTAHAGAAALAHHHERGFRIHSGIGTTDPVFAPLSVRFEYGAWALGVATSAVSIDGIDLIGGIAIQPINFTRIDSAVGTANSTLGRTDLTVRDARVVPYSESGIGDTLVSVSWAWYEPKSWLPLFVELTGSLKIPTGSEAKQISTGDYDGILQLDLAKPIGRFTPFATLGYRINGGEIELGVRPVVVADFATVLPREIIEIENTFQATVGTSVLLTDSLFRAAGRRVPLHAGVMYDFQQSPVKLVDDDHELVPFFSLELSENVQIGPYFIVGLSKAAPDWGVATQIVLSY